MKIGFENLDDQELTICEYTTQGYSAKEIGVKMGLGESTVFNLRSRLIRCMEFRNATQLAVEYYGYKIRKGQVSG